MSTPKKPNPHINATGERYHRLFCECGRPTGLRRCGALSICDHCWSLGRNGITDADAVKIKARKAKNHAAIKHELSLLRDHEWHVSEM